ncbi:MAG TPA: GEVED domain-containing protein [Isosphaeraceae bacterium]
MGRAPRLPLTLRVLPLRPSDRANRCRASPALRGDGPAGIREDRGTRRSARFTPASGPHAVPAGATLGVTYARFRLSTAGGLTPTGAAADGEVEDFRVTLATGSLQVAAVSVRR